MLENFREQTKMSVVGFPTTRMLLLPLIPNTLDVVKHQVSTLHLSSVHLDQIFAPLL